MLNNKIKHIIAIASGKGGVGKSTIALYFALSLAKLGGKVGLLDADIYGPSIPTMVGKTNEKPIIKDKTISPIHAYGLKTMSIGYLVDNRASLAWRGPMLGKALEQLLHDTVWEELDYLIVDLPPGTGDIQLTLCQKIPVSGAIIVTTPQELSLIDVRRACEMFIKLQVPLLGVIENMSYYHCIQCGHDENLFGQGGAKKLCEEYQLPLLAHLPLQKEISIASDEGAPLLKNEILNHFTKLAENIVDQLKRKSKDFSFQFPTKNMSDIKEDKKG